MVYIAQNVDVLKILPNSASKIGIKDFGVETVLDI